MGMLSSMDWLEGTFTGSPSHGWLKTQWFSVDFPLNQSIDIMEEQRISP